MTELAATVSDVARPALAPELTGLTTAEVTDRQTSGRTNDVPNPTSRTYGQIIRANVFTRFNALLGVLLVAILAVGEYRDALFGFILILNTAIGIIQETRAKQTLDKLTLLSAPHAKVRRDGAVVEVTVAAVVLDEVVDLAPGDQVSVDGVVLAGKGFEVDESLLTGEVDPISKDVGDEVLSGSFVASGSGVIRATKVGTDAYAYKIREDASRFTLVKSDLRDGVNRILKIVTWLMVPTAVLLVSAQIRFQNQEATELTLQERITDAVQGSVAGLVAMVPEGLVLLTSMAFALGVIRLGRKNVLTQELAAIEGLARVDVICLDKTGTLTEGSLALDTVELLDETASDDHTGDVLAALVASDPNPNPSLGAIGVRYDRDPGWPVPATVPFSSARKWAAADLGDHGAWYLGAPDILLTHADPGLAESVGERITGHAAQGRRVIMLASSPSGLEGEGLPSTIVPHALVVLAEQVRHDAADTIGYFLDQGVKVKVISGDSPVTVGAVATRVGVPGADHPVDARTLPPNDDIAGLAEALEANSVFGRVTPQQKRAMVHALQSNGHEVAMTGDGVNDTLALKDAEIGIAMGSGSPAARSVARFVILDNSFAVFPSVVAEGRRVIANVERVANLFLTKTFYAMFLSITVGLFGMAFPFFPRHFTLISGLTIGIPAFFLALAPNSTRARPGFLPRVLRFAIPAGATAFVATFTTYTIATRQLEGTMATDEALMQSRTSATLTLFCVGIVVLSILARPWAWWKALLVAAMVLAFLLVLWVPFLHDYFAIDLPASSLVWTAVGIGVGAGLVLEVATRVFKLVEHPVREGRADAAALATRRPAEQPYHRAMAAPKVPEPMRAVLGEMPVDESPWAFEVKWDGVRAIGAIVDDELHLRSSNGNDITPRYPELAGIIDQLAGRSAVLDGEVVRLDAAGRPDFGALQSRMHLTKAAEVAKLAASAPVTWALFDLLAFDGTDTTSLPYEDRRRLLEALIEPGPYWQVPATHIGHGSDLLEAVRERGLEGVMAKKLGSPYVVGKRSSSWRKIKVRQHQELVVGGWRSGREGGSRADGIGALLVGAYDGERLVYAGRVGSGLTQTELRWYRDHFATRTLAACPFDPPPTRAEQADATWVEPDVVVEVAFGEWSHEDRLRHPVYLGRRDDKDPRSVVHERIRPGDAT